MLRYTISLLLALGISSPIAYPLFHHSHEHKLFIDTSLKNNELSIELSAFEVPRQSQKKEHKHIVERVKKLDKTMPKTRPIKRQEEEQSVEKIEQKTISNAIAKPKEAAVQGASTTHSNLLIKGDISDEFLATILRLINKNISYPRIARKFHMEGVVKLRFSVLHGGQLGSVQLVGSSGYEVLNKAAITTLKNAAKSFPSPRSEVVLEVPVQYILH